MLRCTSCDPKPLRVLAPGRVAPANEGADRRSRNFRKHLLLVGTALMAASTGVLTDIGTARAQQTWIGTTGVYETNTNWSGGSAPVNVNDRAFFSDTGTVTNITVGSSHNINQWIFTDNAQSYTLSVKIH